jgi:hypothetical protein
MRFILSHRHLPRDCAVAYSAWKGFDSPLRHASTLATCISEPAEPAAEHLLIWTVDAESEDEALSLLPDWLADRTEVRRVAEVSIP